VQVPISMMIRDGLHALKRKLLTRPRSLSSNVGTKPLLRDSMKGARCLWNLYFVSLCSISFFYGLVSI
jgi:hypothetical protein